MSDNVEKAAEQVFPPENEDDDDLPPPPKLPVRMGPGYVGAMIQKYESGPAAPEEPAVKPAVAEAKAVIKTSVRGEPIDTEEVDDEKISKLGNMFISTVIIESDGEEREVKELVMSSEDLSSSPDSSVLSDDEPTEYAFDDENAYEIPKSDSV